MTENSAIFNARHGADSFRPHRQPAPTAQDCLKRGNEANWRTTRQLSGECRLKFCRDRLGLRAGEPGPMEDRMERRLFLKCIFAGAGAAAIAFALPSRALTRVAPIEPVDEAPVLTPEAAVATPEDMERAKIEKTYWYWRRRRRWHRRYWRRHYW